MAQAGEIVASLQLKIKDFKKGMDNAHKELTNFESTTGKIAKKSAKALAGISVAAGGVAAGVAVASVKMAADVEKMSSRMQAATGASTAEMEEFGDVADNLFKAGRGNYEEIYSTLTGVKQILGQTGDEAENTANKALIMSKTFGWEVSESIRAADSAQKAWGTTSGKSFDTFTALAQQAGDKSGDLLDTFNEYAPALADSGVSMETFSGALAAGMEQGAFNFDKIGDSLKEFNVKMTDGSAQTHDFTNEMFGSKKAADEFFDGIADGSIKGDESLKTVGKQLAKVEDKTKRNQLGVAYFGTMWEDLGGDVVLSMANAEGALTGVEGATDKAGKALGDNLSTKVTKIKNAFIVWGKELGDKLLPSLKKVADWVLANMPAIQENMTTAFNTIVGVVTTTIDSFKSLVGFIQDNETKLKALALVLTAVIAPAMAGFILHAGIMKTKALAGLIMNTIRMIAFNYALGLSYLAAYAPILLIIAGIALLIAAIWLIIKNWDTIVKYTKIVWDKIKGILAVSWEWIKSAFSATMTWLLSLWKTVWNAIKTFFVAIWNGIKSAGVAIWNGLKIAFMAVFNAIKTYFTTVLNIYKKIFMTIWNTIVAVGKGIWNGLKKSFMFIFDAIKAYFTKILNVYKTIFTTIWNTIKAVAVGIWNGLKTAAISIFNAIKNTISKVFNKVKSIVTSVWGGIKTVFTNAIDNVKDKVSDGANFFKDTFSGAIDSVKGFFGGLWGSIKGSLSDVVSGIKSKVQDAKEWLGELNPFKRHSPSLVDNVKSGTAIIKKTYEGLGGMRIESPSIGNVSAGRVDLNESYGSDNGSGGGTNYNAPIVQVENMNVRDDQDVRNVSQELYGLQRNHDRSKGGR